LRSAADREYAEVLAQLLLLSEALLSVVAGHWRISVVHMLGGEDASTTVLDDAPHQDAVRQLDSAGRPSCDRSILPKASRTGGATNRTLSNLPRSCSMC